MAAGKIENPRKSIDINRPYLDGRSLRQKQRTTSTKQIIIIFLFLFHNSQVPTTATPPHCCILIHTKVKRNPNIHLYDIEQVKGSFFIFHSSGKVSVSTAQSEHRCITNPSKRPTPTDAPNANVLQQGHEQQEQQQQQ